MIEGRIEMPVTGKYVRFQLLGQTRKNEIWLVLSKSRGSLLGTIRWYSPWRQYCFFPGEASFNFVCLDDVSAFLKELMDQKKEKLPKSLVED
jgi:hypothetical protein